MSVATGTAIAIGIGAASAASSAYGAHKASNAAKEAAKIQGQSADKAQGFNQQVYDNQRQITQPYIAAGNESLARLMSQHWGTPYQPPPQPGPGPGMPGPGPSRPNPNAMGPMAMGRPNPPSLAGMQAQGAAPPPQGGAPMVQMRAPTGEVSAVPLPMVPQFEAKGAKRVS